MHESSENRVNKQFAVYDNGAQLGSESGWKENFSLTYVDSQPPHFSRALAAQISVPEYLTYNQTVPHIVTNEMWNGSSSPTWYDPLFISIVNELKPDANTELKREIPVCSCDSEYQYEADQDEIELSTTLFTCIKTNKMPDFNALTYLGHRT